MRQTEQTARELYVQSLYANEDAGLRAIRERLIHARRWGVNIGPVEGRMLQIFIQMISAKKVVEIGTLYGYSGVWIARALPEDGHLYTLERDPDCLRMAQLAFAGCGVNEKVTVVEGDAEESLRKIEINGPFDVVFIDANKSAYLEYLGWAQKNLRAGGLLIADNVLLGGGVVQTEKPINLSKRQWSGMRAFNEAIADRSHFNGVILPTSEGMTVALKMS